MMKYNKYIFALILVFFATLDVFAQASLNIDDFKIRLGETKNIQIELQNDVPVRALQARLILPEGLELASRLLLNDERVGSYTDEFGNTVTSQKSVSYNKWDDNSYMIVVNSDDAVAFAGNSGAILSFNIRAKENTFPQDVVISLCDIELVYENGEDFIKQDVYNCNVCIYTIYNIVTTSEGSGEVVGGGDYESGREVTLTAIPANGYKFQKWSNGSTDNPYSFIAKNNLEICAIFTECEYTLTYKVDGEVYRTETLSYGATITPLAAPEKEGYTFSGWSEIPATMPAHDVVIEGTFSVNRYTLTYKVDGEVYKTETLSYGAVVTPLAAPVKEGHTFSGWS
ncbi:MAG: InlB B-repeat-containing protein, partial [Bacteroidaceae bacterium]|nr:InlB B-repeat-containing protein [Bacteroidaceae bacterium]